MENTQSPLFTVSDFIALTNQTLEYAYPSVQVEGEVASFKVNQGKYVFFDLKDDAGSIGCFMTVWQLRQPIEDGMKIIVTATPKLTQWGKFSLTVRALRPSGEGSLKKSFELLKAKLSAEGLFAPERKRTLPGVPQHIAIISSTQAAGYADFIKILNDRWGGLKVDVAHVQVQGADAPDQMIRALKYFNEREVLPQVIVIIRGGGSADDLSAFNDELLVREIATSRVPTLVGVGHETDESLADLAADVRAATPSNAAQIIVPDRQEIIRSTRYKVQSVLPRTLQAIEAVRLQLRGTLGQVIETVERHYQQSDDQLGRLRHVLAQLDPSVVLKRGYALIRGEQKVGSRIEIETHRAIIGAKVERYDKK
ncbi:MAG: putative Exodeoxyribonuclease 7 large subunit [Candidatus Saccharibacteria bacterium]|nr:putative Exodeoxyribonuclease 7 large subunit [Candidatus Saccharibacteria bacterium]